MAGHLLFLDSLIKRLYIDLADTLRTSHHVSRVHSLISRYHHKLLHTVFHTQVGNHLGTIDIVLHGLAGVILHHRHMLIGCSMEHIVRTETLENLLHTILLTDRSNHSLSLDVSKLLLHHQSDIMFRSLSLVYQHHSCRLELSHLTHHLRTDGTSRTGNQHTLTTEKFAYRLEVDTNLRTWQQFFYAHLTNLLTTKVNGLIIAIIIVVGIHLNGTLSHIDLSTSLNQHILYLLVLSELLHTVRSHQHTINIIFTDNCSQIIVNSIYLFSQYLLMLNLSVMRDKTFHHESARSLTSDALSQSYSPLHCTIDKYSCGTGTRESHLIHCFHKHTQSPHEQCRNEENQDDACIIEIYKILVWPSSNEINNDKHNNQCHGITIGHTHQVDKT